MGAAFVGTLLGGGAVWLGVAQHFERLEQEIGKARADIEQARETSLAAPEPAAPMPAASPADLEPPPPVTGERERADPGDSDLVRAIETTRESVVSLELAGGTAGAGVVYDEDGTLLTNYHVIEPALRASALLAEAAASSITVRFVDGRERGARVLAADPDEDIAILGLLSEESERFAAVPLGQSAELRLGEQVFAIGSPVGFEGTVATGIISSLERTGVLTNRALPVLQLDAAINFGNSGGPLFNLAGELVGITTARSSRGEGIGFALPIDRIRLFLQALEGGVDGRSGVIGVELDARAEVAAKIGPLGYRSGVLVSVVDEGQAAARAGMQPGDILVSLRGRQYDEFDASESGRERFGRLVGESIRGLLPGETLAVGVVRGEQLVELELVVEAASRERQARIEAEELLGLQLHEDQSDARVASLVPGSPISRTPGAQLLRDAKLISVLGEPVGSIEDLGEHLSLVRRWAIGRGGRSIAIDFELEDGRKLRAARFPLIVPR